MVVWNRRTVLAILLVAVSSYWLISEQARQAAQRGFKTNPFHLLTQWIYYSEPLQCTNTSTPWMCFNWFQFRLEVSRMTSYLPVFRCSFGGLLNSLRGNEINVATLLPKQHGSHWPVIAQRTDDEIQEVRGERQGLIFSNSSSLGMAFSIAAQLAVAACVLVMTKNREVELCQLERQAETVKDRLLALEERLGQSSTESVKLLQFTQKEVKKIQDRLQKGEESAGELDRLRQVQAKMYDEFEQMKDFTYSHEKSAENGAFGCTVVLPPKRRYREMNRLRRTELLNLESLLHSDKQDVARHSGCPYQKVPDPKAHTHKLASMVADSYQTSTEERPIESPKSSELARQTTTHVASQAQSGLSERTDIQKERSFNISNERGRILFKRYIQSQNSKMPEISGLLKPLQVVNPNIQSHREIDVNCHLKEQLRSKSGVTTSLSRDVVKRHPTNRENEPGCNINGTTKVLGEPTQSTVGTGIGMSGGIHSVQATPQAPIRYMDLSKYGENKKRYKRLFIHGRGWVALNKLELEEQTYGSRSVIREGANRTSHTVRQFDHVH